MDRLIIFDLDETLIHSIRDEYEQMPPNAQRVFLVEPGSQEAFANDFYVLPHLIKCLKMVNERYEVAVFTAGYDWYADPIINQIDPTGTLIQHRFYRHHARQVFNQDNQPLFIKDLSIFAGLDLRKVLFVDNHVFSFALNLKNGIPVVDFLGD